jgi:hypothetical protein
MNKENGNRIVRQASKIIARLALLDETGRCGECYEDAGVIPWQTRLSF